MQSLVVYLDNSYAFVYADAVPLFRFEDIYLPAADDVGIFFDDLGCGGTELRLEDCDASTNTEDCIHFLQDAGVECQPADV